MSIYEFMIESPATTLILALFALIALGFVLTLILSLTFKPFNRWIRHKNIVAKGWPPPHLDADGDFKPEGDES